MVQLQTKADINLQPKLKFPALTFANALLCADFFIIQSISFSNIKTFDCQDLQ